MALAIDSSTPAFKAGLAGSQTSGTSNSFSPPAGSLVAVFFVNGQATDISSMTDNLGAHLPYAKLIGAAVNQTDCEIWTANCTSSQSNVVVTANFSGTIIGSDSAIGVIVFTGAATTQNGATQTATSVNGTPSATLTTTANDSLVIGAITNWSSSTLPTIPGGQTDVFDSLTFAFQNVGTGTSGWVQGQSATTPSSGTNVTINDTAPTIQYSMVIAEILAQSSGTSIATTAWLRA